MSVVNSEQQSGPVLEVQSVSRVYKKGRQKIAVLDDVSLCIQQGDFVAITGPSGTGKSTLLHLMGGLDRPTSGKVFIDGIDVSRLRDRALSQLRGCTIGFVFQFFYLQPFLTVENNIQVPAMFARRARKNRRDDVSKLLSLVGLDGKGGYYPGELSGGQLQRVGVARALINSPRLLLADEPTGNLDSENSQQIIALFRQLAKELNVTVVVVTHDAEVASAADRVLQIKDGRLMS